MKVIYDPGQIKLKKSAVAIGVFDGLHLGHQLLIKSMVSRARKLKLQPVVVTFFPHPAHVLSPERPLSYLMALEDRLKSLERLGVKHVMVIRFNRKFAQIDPNDFIKDILVGCLGAQWVFVGEDFRFGKDRKGDVSLFKRLARTYGYQLSALKAVKRAGERVSSGRLRTLIANGDLKSAQKLLDRPFSITGKVVRGDSRGRKLGYPTANVSYGMDVLPPCGVYAVSVLLGKKELLGMANLGLRPSFKSNDSKIHLEVNIFDFNRNIYGQTITVKFLKKIRDEKTFPTINDLVLQIQKDEITIRRFLKQR